MNLDSTNYTPAAKIKVIGVGGGGTNAVSTMIKGNIGGVDFIAVNTDMQSLKTSLAPVKIQIGKELTKGLGAGSDPSVGRDAALEDRNEIQEVLAGSDMVFITAGMGGGTGTGGASVVAQIARDLGALTVAIVTKPFMFEGKRRKAHAEIGIERLRENVDTLIVIPNERLLEIMEPDLSLIGAFNLADSVLVNAVRGISDIINIPGTINVDFADVKTIMSCTGQALMGIGRSSGKNRAIEAAQQAISSPLLEDIDIQGASGILINITASENISLLEVNESCTIIQESAHDEANIIFGAVIDENMGDEIRVTVIATGFNDVNNKAVAKPFPKSKYSEPDAFKTRISPRHQSNDNRNQYKPMVEFKNKDNQPAQEHSNMNHQGMMVEPPMTTPMQAIPKEVYRDEKTQTATSMSAIKPELPIMLETDDIHLDIDKKIDEALELAERVDLHDQGDNLDIPSFLRRDDQPTL